jgi:hypothetical protein
VLLIILAGCAGPARPPGRLAAPSAPVPVPPTCPSPPASAVPFDPTFGNAGPGGTVPAGFAPVAALRCSIVGHARTPGAPGGRPVTVIEERTSTGLDGLLDVLRLPWATAGSPVCPASLVAAPYVVLVGADGRAIRPALPRDGCGQPRAEVLAVITALPWRAPAEQPE